MSPDASHLGYLRTGRMSYDVAEGMRGHQECTSSRRTCQVVILRIVPIRRLGKWACAGKYWQWLRWPADGTQVSARTGGFGWWNRPKVWVGKYTPAPTRRPHLPLRRISRTRGEAGREVGVDLPSPGRFNWHESCPCRWHAACRAAAPRPPPDVRISEMILRPQVSRPWTCLRISIDISAESGNPGGIVETLGTPAELAE